MVLTGDQGAGKTSFIEKLALLPEWYCSLNNIKGKDAISNLVGKIIVELEEFVALRNAKSADEAKLFISARASTVRLPYERFSADVKRTCVLVATTNDATFLGDFSGERRYLPVQVQAENIVLPVMYNPEKFPVLESISYQVGRTGAITPVANLTPVLLAGTVVKRASMHNADQIEKLDIRIGDSVYVEKGGEIIPKIVGVNLDKREANAQPVQYITHCPECNTELIRNEGEAQHYCPNTYSCPPQITGKIQHFISRKAMDIQGLGEETVELLFRTGIIHTYADLYEITIDKLLPLERMAQKSAENIVKGIEQSKKVPFERVLFALGIRYVGETVAKKLARHYKTIEALEGATIEQLIEVDEIGNQIANSVVSFFADDYNRKLIERLKGYGLQFALSEQATEGQTDSLKGLTFVVSGVFHLYSRDELKALIEQHGGKVGSSISSKTNYVIVGDNMGPSKKEKAEQLGVKMISEEAFQSLIIS